MLKNWIHNYLCVINDQKTRPFCETDKPKISSFVTCCISSSQEVYTWAFLGVGPLRELICPNLVCMCVVFLLNLGLCTKDKIY